MVPSGSNDPVESTAAVAPSTVAVKPATGGWFGAVTVTDLVNDADAPALSVTVRVTGYVPLLTYVWVALTPAPAGAPSPQFQAYVAMVPSGSRLPEASPVTLSALLDTVNAADGVWFPAPEEALKLSMEVVTGEL